MLVILVFIGFTAALDAGAVGISSIVERYSEHASLLTFLGLFVLSFVLAWHLAVWITERFFTSDDQKEKNIAHVKWVETLFVKARR